MNDIHQDMDEKMSSVVDPKIDLAEEEYTEAESRKVVRKLDIYILPIMFVLFTLQFMDKQALNYGAIWGLKTDLKLTSDQYAWTGSIFYFGYLLAQFIFPPLVHKVPIAKACGVFIFLWSAVLMTMPACKNFTGLACQRFFLGVCEGGITPAFVVLTSLFYTRQEQALRSSVWYNGNAMGNIIGGALGYAFGEANTNLQKWQLFPLVFGAISLGFSAAFVFLVPDSVEKARFFNDDERRVAVLRVRSNMTGVARGHFNWYEVREALIDPKTWLILIIALPNALQASGPGTFGSQIVKNFGFSTLHTTVLQAVPTGAFQFLTTVGAGYIATHYKDMRLILIVIVNLPAIIGGACLYSLPKSNKALLAPYILVYGAACTQSLYLTFLSSNVAGYTKKTVVAVGSLLMYSAGQIAGPHFFTEPPYALGFGMMMTCYSIIIVTAIILRFYCVRENKRRDAAHLHMDVSQVVADEQDLTDWQRKATFRYAL
ncbi:hypothetical protein TREMEDRAFT_63465 [Tremella mesenterica DSM 1558]|uniref:uncharacterized protein n=1 Tax=Tremella mesenterica (strain ATCC 24925 / CBS 8224 / DSM 1558 / NBRC 9311 / NRRL Y-6157 / RJB 2259-6 / UBC 559-6) TaxID=578456 RepID=UPI0003F49382|nr:uncharacterized protein TREMEDRAFT_63465 [Tremella mesenterica DSM 1558]EIW68293.1 hypothetical protein TREMEDRAFT_63465 [Tremella mesenterica DSM 1558]